MNYLHSDAVILVFCKAPVPGQVKTRLTPIYSDIEAADIHIRLTRHTLSLVSQAQLAPVQLWCSPSTDFPFFKTCAETYRLSLHQQLSGNLGTRMHQAFCTTLKSFRQVVLIGCDCPSLTKADLYDAIQALKQNHDIVLAPAEDGGYTLIGLTRPCPEIFSDIAWGSSSVFKTTTSRIKQLNLQYHQIRQQWDIDTPADLERFHQMENN